MSNSLAVVLFTVLIVVNGFFVAVEFAFVASRRTKLEAMTEKGLFGSRAAWVATGNLNDQLFAAQLGITIASLILGLFAEATLEHILEEVITSFVEIPDSLLHTIAFAGALFIVTFTHTVFGEMVPKNIAIAAPETSSRLLAPTHMVIFTLLRPVIWFLNGVASPLVRLFGVRPRDGLNEAHTPQELTRMLDESAREGLVEEQEHALLIGALDFADRRVRSAMIPRTDIISIARTDSVRSIEQAVVQTGHSRLPVVGADGATIIGFVHAKDLVRLPADAQHEALPLELIRRMLQVGIDRKLDDVLIDMRRYRTHMALVTAAGGSVVGMITLEDVLEELVGEIYDESDVDA